MNYQGYGLVFQYVIFNQLYKVDFLIIIVNREWNYEGYILFFYFDGMGEIYEVVDFEIDVFDGWNLILVFYEGFFMDVFGFENLVEGVLVKMFGSFFLV